MNINPADWPSRDGLIVSATAPTSARAGSQWFDTTSGILYTRMRESDNVFWVECGAPNVLGASGPTGQTGSASPKAITVIAPTASEKIPLFYTTSQIVLSQICSLISGGTSVDFRIRYASDFSTASPTDTTTNAIVANSATTGVSTTSFSNGTISANNFVWLTTSAVSGVVNLLNVTLIF